MKQADPTAKAVVFSSWSRLLRLVEEALHDNSIPHTSIAGAQADTRVAALRRFMTDPECTVLTVVMSTGGGAAGLTLTVASHVFLLEPNLNPGLEAQAAARVYRLGTDSAQRFWFTKLHHALLPANTPVLASRNYMVVQACASDTAMLQGKRNQLG